MKILFIGCGHMGQAILHALYQKENLHIDILVQSATSVKNIRTLYKHSNIHVTNDFSYYTSQNWDIIFICVKPYQIDDILSSYRELLVHGNVLVSVLAGTKIETFEKHNFTNIIRIMPNILAKVNSSYTPIFTKDSRHLSIAIPIVSKFGSVLLCKDENELDIFTTLSGCGPGFLLRIAESFRNNFENIVPPTNTTFSTTQILASLFLGIGHLLQDSSSSIDELWKSVCSKGGATQAGIDEIENARIDDITSNTLKAARNKILEIKKVE